MFLDISGPDFWTVCHVFHFKMFAFALAVQDVFSVEDVCFSVCTVFHCTAESRWDGTDVQMTAIYFMYADSCYFIYAGSCYFMYAESRYFIFMLTAVQEQRSRLFYVYLIYAESRT